MKYRYPFTHEITFALVMQDPRLCKGLLQLIFPERVINEVRMHKPDIDVEKSLIVGLEARKVRLDVLFEDNNEWYDIEMQSRNEHNIPKRSRYAHGIMDVHHLKPGRDFNELKASYVIFLCCFDPFEKNQPVYTFQMLDEQNLLPLGDESYTIILNSRAAGEATPADLRALFNYMNDESISGGNELLHQIDESVHSWNTGERMELIMTLEQEILIKEERARKEGLKEGYEQGEKAGFDRGCQETADKVREEYICNLMDNLNLPREKAIAALGLDIAPDAEQNTAPDAGQNR